jgi:hypothetical protein
MNGFQHKVKTFYLKVVVPGDNECSLRKAYMVSDLYPVQIIDPDPLTDPAVIPHLQEPGILDIYFGV